MDKRYARTLSTTVCPRFSNRMCSHNACTSIGSSLTVSTHSSTTSTTAETRPGCVYCPHAPLKWGSLKMRAIFFLPTMRSGLPDSRIFQRALSLAGIDPKDAAKVLFIGDRLELDVYPAKASGMQTLHFNRSKSRPGITPSPPDVTSIYDWDEFDGSPHPLTQ
jgi:hypothetical protein